MQNKFIFIAKFQLIQIRPQYSINTKLQEIHKTKNKYINIVYELDEF